MGELIKEDNKLYGVFFKKTEEPPFVVEWTKEESELTREEIDLLVGSAIKRVKDIYQTLPEAGKKLFILDIRYKL